MDISEIETDMNEWDEYSDSDIEDSTVFVRSSFKNTMEIIDNMENRGTEPILNEIDILVNELRSSTNRSEKGYGNKYPKHVFAVNRLLEAKLVSNCGIRKSEIDTGKLMSDAIDIVKDIADALENNKVNIAKELARQKANQKVDIVREGLEILARATISVVSGEIFTTALDVASLVVKNSTRFFGELLRQMDRASELT